MKAEYINPHENSWHPNDFAIGERYVCDDRVFLIMAKNDDDNLHFWLQVKWEDNGKSGRIYPNDQWIALNWEDDDAEV